MAMMGDADRHPSAGADGGPTMTLAVDREAVEALARPSEAIDGAREWSRYVGVVGDDTDAVRATVDRYGLDQDFHLGGLDAQSVLSRLKWEADTDRYVYIGTDERDRELAEYVNWEYLPVGEAAEAAGWARATGWDPAGFLKSLLPW